MKKNKRMNDTHPSVNHTRCQQTTFPENKYIDMKHSFIVCFCTVYHSGYLILHSLGSVRNCGFLNITGINPVKKKKKMEVFLVEK